MSLIRIGKSPAAALLLLLLVTVPLVRYGSACKPGPGEDPDAWPYLLLEGHEKWVSALAFSPDGALLASGAGLTEHSGEGRLWDLATARLRFPIPAQKGPMYAAAFSSDGRTLATGDVDGRVWLWDPATGQQRAVLTGPAGTVHGLAFSPADGTLAVYSQLANTGTDELTLWDASTARKRLVLHERKLMGFSPDGKVLATCDRTHVWFRDLASGDERLLHEGCTGFTHALGFSADGPVLAMSGPRSPVRLLYLGTGRERAIEAHEQWAFALAFSPDGRTLATGSIDRVVKLWDVATGQERATLTGHTASIYSLAFAPDGRRLASGSFDKTVRVWSLPE